MGHWANSTAQFIGATSGTLVQVVFDYTIVPGDNPIVQDGVYIYNYTLNLGKPGTDPGPTKVGVVLGIKPNGSPPEEQIYATSFGVIDTGERTQLIHTGELILHAGDKVMVGVFTHEFEGMLAVKTLVRQCTLLLRRVGPIP